MAGSAAYYVGVDVGTGSARAGLVSGDGRVLCTRSVNLEVDNPRSGFYHQSTEQVWAAIETCVADVLKNANGGVKGIGFDATCSLVLVDGQGKTIRFDIVPMVTAPILLNFTLASHPTRIPNGTCSCGWTTVRRRRQNLSMPRPADDPCWTMSAAASPWRCKHRSCCG